MTWFLLDIQVFIPYKCGVYSTYKNELFKSIVCAVARFFSYSKFKLIELHILNKRPDEIKDPKFFLAGKK